MIYIVPTKKGFGIEIWGTYDDLNNIYEVLGKFCNDEKGVHLKGAENRNKLISSFSYEIRKAKEGNRLKRKSSYFSHKKQEYLGTQISWVHFLFSLTVIKYNMRFYETNKYDISMILQIEFWLEKAMNSYDETGAKSLIDFIDDALYGANSYIYHFMRSINQDFFMLGGGKRAFRKLPDLLRRGIFFTNEYKEYEAYLRKEAERLNCEINEMDIDDDEINYNIKW